MIWFPLPEADLGLDVARPYSSPSSSSPPRGSCLCSWDAIQLKNWNLNWLLIWVFNWYFSTTQNQKKSIEKSIELTIFYWIAPLATRDSASGCRVGLRAGGQPCSLADPAVVRGPTLLQVAAKSARGEAAGPKGSTCKSRSVTISVSTAGQTPFLAP